MGEVLVKLQIRKMFSATTGKDCVLFLHMDNHNINP